MVGVQDTARSVLLLVAAIAVHKLPTHMALTTRYLRAGYSVRRLMWWLAPFTLVSPVSVLIGMAISNAASPVVDLILLSLGAGVFVYIGATEVICEEFEHLHVPPGHSAVAVKMRKFVAVAAGVLVIFPVIFVPHEH